MDVQELAVDVRGHDRALDVPAWPTGAPLALPAGLARLGLLPQREIVRVALLLLGVLAHQRALALLHLLGSGARGGAKLPVVVSLRLEGLDVEVNAARRGVRDADILQALDEFLDPAVHVLGDPRSRVRPQDVERVHVGEVGILEAPRVALEHVVVGDRVAALLVQHAHERLAARLQDGLGVAGLDGLVDALHHRASLLHFQRVLLQLRLELRLVLCRGAGRGLLGGLGLELRQSRAGRVLGDLL
mmetsp:Transcript_73135/g.223715  ORF Transcript_73135/g.223715 Transcript_73135/m.223715 type:complete len:245 (+) Transcript_73135:478-1212(+)